MFSTESLLTLPYILAAFIPALTFHEWGHAMMATRFGDPTPRLAGRLSLNPLVHLDPLGTIMVFLIHFGWGKPVPINASYFRHPWAEFWVAIAGPGMNFVLAVTSAILLRLNVSVYAGPQVEPILNLMLGFSLMINLALAFFNLIPIGPLDGQQVLARFLPANASRRFTDWNAEYGGQVLFGIFLLDMVTRWGFLSRLINVPSQYVAGLLMGQGLR